MNELLKKISFSFHHISINPYTFIMFSVGYIGDSFHLFNASSLPNKILIISIWKKKFKKMEIDKKNKILCFEKVEKVCAWLLLLYSLFFLDEYIITIFLQYRKQYTTNTLCSTIVKYIYKDLDPSLICDEMISCSMKRKSQLNNSETFNIINI